MRVHAIAERVREVEDRTLWFGVQRAAATEHAAAMDEREKSFSAEQDEMLEANANLEEALAEAKAANAAQTTAAAAAAPASAAAAATAATATAASAEATTLRERVTELEKEVSLVTTAHGSKVRELMSCQEMLAQTKSQLLNLQLAQEELQQQQQSQPSASSSGIAANPAAAAAALKGSVKGLFKKK